MILATPNLTAAESLRDSLRNAYQNSGLLVQNRALLRAADEKVAGAVAALRPVISWSSKFSHSYNDVANSDSVTTSLNAKWLLYDFGSSDLQTDALEKTVLATRESLVSIEQNVLLRAVTAHMNYRRSVEFVSLRSANVELIEQELRAAQDRFEVGEVTRTDVALAEARLASARAALAASRAAMAQRDAKRAGLHVAGLEVEQEVRNAFVVLEVARAKGTATDRQIEAASVAFRGVREEASLGARTTLDVLNAEQELLDARVSRISTRIDEQIASYSLLAAMGKLTATELDLGVKTYDPAEYYNLVKSAPRAKSKQGAALDRVLQGLAGN